MGDSQFDKAMEGLESEARARLERGEDMGHNKLLGAIAGLLAETQALQFHDFLNMQFVAPKQELAMRFERLREAVMQGEFDN